MRRAIIAAAVTALAARRAAAQESPDEVVRRDLIAQAERARLAGDHATAVDRGRRAAQLRATPSIQYFLAREYEALGQPVETLAQAGACARGAEADAALHSREVILRACRAIVARAAPRVGRVLVHLDGPLPPDGVVRVGDSPLSTAVLDVAYPVNPGAVRVSFIAPGYEPWQRDVSVAAGAIVDVPVAFTPLAPPSPPSPPPPPPAPPPPPPARIAPSAPPWSPPVAGPVTLAGVGVASLVAAGALFVLSLDAQGERDAICPDGACQAADARADAAARDASYRGYLVAADVTLGVGAAALAGASLWWLLPRVMRQPLPAFRVSYAPFSSNGARASVVFTW